MIEVLKQSLEALELALRSHGVMLLSDPPQDAWKTYGVESNARQSITSLRQAIAELESQEPVAWMFQHDETGRMNYVSNDGIHNPTVFLEMNPRYALVCPLYTHPPQRTEQEPVKLPCCGYTDASAVKWNPFNRVVQCHNCGQTYSVKWALNKYAEIERSKLKERNS
jgi:hypothetical protein